MAQLILQIVGKKNTGKTSLMVKLITQFTQLKYKVATIKHDGGGHFDWETKGKDTSLFGDSGSIITSIVAGSQFAVRANKPINLSIKKIVSLFYEDADIIFIEGFKSMTGNKIETVRKGVSDTLLSAKKDLIATFGDLKLSDSPLHFEQDDFSELVNYILKMPS